MIDLYGSPESVQWFEEFIDTAIWLARMGAVDTEPNNHDAPIPGGAVELRKHRTTTLPTVRYRVWLDRRSNGEKAENGEEEDKPPASGSRIRMGDADAEDLLTLMRMPRSACRGNRWHSKCKWAVVYNVGVDCEKMCRRVDSRKCVEYEAEEKDAAKCGK